MFSGLARTKIDNNTDNKIVILITERFHSGLIFFLMSLDNTKFALTNALKLFNDNNVNSALEQLEEILKVYPDNKEALELIISINIKINDPINALKYINHQFIFSS